ncbi:MAG: ribosome maturation factor RimM [Firmicutes bacterium]|nr:ribosome maturation factor RimM [Bacillota bacterium]
MKKQYLEAGRIINTHGVRGEVKFEHWCDDISSLDCVDVLWLDDRGESPLHITSRRRHQGFILFTFEEITSVEQARTFKTKTLFVNRDDLGLPEGTVFQADLIGLPVTDADSGTLYGHICDIYNRGASDIYEIQSGGRTYLFPAAKEFIVSTDSEKGVAVRPPKGLFG